MRRLRVLSAHPNLGQPNDLRDEFEGAQAYVDAGLAEWAPNRAVPMETTMAQPARETTDERVTLREQASALGVQVDHRWGPAKLRQAIADATKPVDRS